MASAPSEDSRSARVGPPGRTAPRGGGPRGRFHRLGAFSLSLGLLLGGCILDLLPHAEEPREGPLNPGEGPDNTPLHAAVLTDVRQNRILAGRLDEGMPSCPWIRVDDRGRVLCTTEGSRMEVLILRRDPLDQRDRAEETAFYCPKESRYWYHYEGGPQKLNVWLGPFRLEMASRASDH